MTGRPGASMPEGGAGLTHLLWGRLFEDGPAMGLVLNFLLSGLALLGGAMFGVPLGVFRAMSPPSPQAPVVVVLGVLRATPVLLLVLWSFLFIQVVLGLPLEPIWIGCIALGLYAMTHISDIVRAGTRAVSKDQIRTAQSLGLSRVRIAQHVLVPVSVRVMIPAFATFSTSLFKDSSVCYVIGVVELMQLALLETARHPRHLLHYYAVMALIFFLVNVAGTRLASRFEQRYKLPGAL